MPYRRRISRLVTGTAAALAAAAFFLPPGIYFLLTYYHWAGNLESEAEVVASSLTRIISLHPDLWEYQQVRLREYLEHRPLEGDRERRRILNLKGEAVAEIADSISEPWITESSPLMDAGVVVGSIEISRSLRPLILRAGLLALLLAPLAAGAFVILRTAPLRAIRQSEEALRRQRDEAQRYLDVAGVAFVILDREGRVRLVNRQGAEILGRSEAEVTGREWVSAFVDEVDRPRVASRFSSCGRPGELISLEYAVLRPSGERRHISWYVAPLEEDGAPAGLLASGIDVTAQRQLEAQLGHAQKLEALGQLASGVAHDFSNIVSVVRGYADLVRRALRAGDPSLDHVGEILAAADRAASLTESLLTFGRRQEMRREPLDVVEVVRGVHRFLRHLVRPNIEVRVELPAEALVVTGDRVQLEQVLMNLVTNARDAMPHGGRITVSAARVHVDDDRASRRELDDPGAYAEVSVSDTGTGMDGATRARLFEPFFTTKGPGQGTGLGLAIAYGIVRKHQGCIEVASEPGGGSTFAVLLPLRVGAERVEPAAGGASRGA